MNSTKNQNYSPRDAMTSGQLKTQSSARYGRNRSPISKSGTINSSRVQSNPGVTQSLNEKSESLEN